MKFILFLLIALTGLKRPESVLPTSKGIFISDIGEFGRDEDGKVFRMVGDTLKKFAEKLNDPKGLAYFDGYIYVADVNKIWRLKENEKSVVIESDSFPVKPEFLNDMVVDSSGNLYVSDTWGDVIFKIDKTGRASVFARVKKPNGLAIHNNHVYCVTFTKPGRLYVIKSGEPQKLYESHDIDGADGLVIKGNSVYISGYISGKVVQLKLTESGCKLQKIVKDGLRTPADIGLDSKANILYIPLLQEGKVLKVPLK